MANVMTNSGKSINQNRLKGTAGYPEPVYLAWGTGAGTAAVADTALFSEADEARVAASSTITTTAVTNDTYRLEGTLTATGTKTITNAGNFDEAKAAAGTPSGRIHMKIDHAGVPVNADDTITYVLEYQQVD